MEKDEILRGVTSSASYDLSTSLPATYGSIPAPRAAAVDFRQSLCLSTSFSISIMDFVMSKPVDFHQLTKQDFSKMNFLFFIPF